MDVPAELVASVARNHVDPDTATRDFGTGRIGLDRHLLGHRVVVVPKLAVPANQTGVEAIDRSRVLVDALPAPCEVLLHDRVAHAADHRASHFQAWDEHACRMRGPVRRESIERLAVQHTALAGLLHVHQRRLAGHGYGLLDRAYCHLRVNGHGRVGLHVHALPSDRAKARQRKRHGVHPGPKLDDRVTALAVGYGASHLFDEHRARRLNGHTRKHGPGRVAHDASD
jgi:hypothetical protein